MTPSLVMGMGLARFMNMGSGCLRNIPRVAIVGSRHYASSDDVCKPPKPLCSSMNLKEKGCGGGKDESKKPASEKKINPPPLPHNEREIVIKVPDECCPDPCKWAYPRFDLLYYKRTDKLNRVYTQTWAECPELLKKPKVICCFDKIQMPKMPKRKPKEKPKTACEIVCPPAASKCPRVTMEGCRPARVPPKCIIIRKPADCEKKKAPYPSFSECKRDIPRPLRPIECKCLVKPALCEVWEYYRKLHSMKKPDKLC